jgi:hypothetical protein
MVIVDSPYNHCILFCGNHNISAQIPPWNSSGRERLRHNGYTSSEAHNLGTLGYLFVLLDVSSSISPLTKIKPNPQSEASKDSSAEVASINIVSGIKDCGEGEYETKKVNNVFHIISPFKNSLGKW